MDAKIKALLLKQKAGQTLTPTEKAELFQFGMSGQSPQAIDPLVNEGGGAMPYQPMPRNSISTEGSNYREKAYRTLDAMRPYKSEEPKPQAIDEDVWAELSSDSPSDIKVDDAQFAKMREALKRGK